MKNPDIFEILDITQREDSYTSIIVEVLTRSPVIATAVFHELTGKTLVAAPEVAFRKSFAPGDVRNIPDVRIHGRTAEGPWWLVIECKIQSGEGDLQCERYKDECRRAVRANDIAGFTLVFLTLNAEPAASRDWRPMSHLALADLIASHALDEILNADAQLSFAWKAFYRRLTHHRDYPRPTDDTILLDWLSDERPDEYFVTQPERACLAGRAVIPPPYATRSHLMIRKGRRQFLLQAWRPDWTTGTWYPDGETPLETCISVHFELDVPLPFDGEYVTCHLHCETNPYMPRKQLLNLGAVGEPYLAFLGRFRETLHRLLPSEGWRPSRTYLQQARHRCPFHAATTVAGLRQHLLPQFDLVSDAVHQALIEQRRANK